MEADICYVPHSRPGPASLMRQVAYHDRKAVPGPEVDPEGWLTLPPVNHTGKLFNGKQSTVQCIVSYLTIHNLCTNYRMSVLSFQLLAR